MQRISLALARWIAFVAVVGMLAISAATTLDVGLRFFFNAPINGFLEIASLTLAIMLAACFPASRAERRHVTVDLFDESFRPRLAPQLIAIGSIILLIFVGLIGWRVAIHAMQMNERGSVTAILETPTWPFWAATAACLIISVPSQVVVAWDDIKNAISNLHPSAKGSGPSRRKTIFAYGCLGLSLTFGIWLLVEGRAAGGMIPGGRETLGYLLFIAMTLLALMLVPLAAAMGLAGIAGMAAIIGTGPALNAFGTQSADFFSNFHVAVIPLFLMMGSFAAAAGIGSDVYALANAVFGHFRGGLAMATIGGCAGFGSVSVSSIATAATVGPMAIGEMRARGYSDELATGSIAAGGTLGALLPPSGIMVLYAIMTENSIEQMFIAALVPALLAFLGYLGAIAWNVWFRPNSAPAAGGSIRWEVLKPALLRNWAGTLLFGLVIGGLYAGAFTATEAAAVGAGAAFLIALARGKMSGGDFLRVLGETAGTTSMIYLLILGGSIFGFFIGLTQMADGLVQFIESLHLAPIVVVLILLVIYIALGTVLDPFAIMVITVPIVGPMITGFGYDPIWWGIVQVIVVEIGVLTPPVGMNLFIMKSIAPDISLATVCRGVMPFVWSSIIKLLLLVFFPALVLWLPRTMG